MRPGSCCSDSIIPVAFSTTMPETRGAGDMELRETAMTTAVTGWRCPTCASCYAPRVPRCSICGPGFFPAGVGPSAGAIVKPLGGLPEDDWSGAESPPGYSTG